MSQIDDIEDLIRRRPHLTEIQIAEELFGPEAYQQKVNQCCRKLLSERRVTRHGKGGPAGPFTYTWGAN